MSDRLSWERDGRDWPNRAASRFIRAGGLRWHVQAMGQGPALLLLHGTGASTHSWRALAPLLARRFTVIAPDLPGHAFTQMPAFHRLSLAGMAQAVRALLDALGVEPAMAAGHSAGAAILVRMSLDGLIAPACLVSLNGALLPWGGAPGQLFAPLARLLAALPMVPRLFAWRAGERGVVEKLIRDTGSRLDPSGIEQYRRLAASPSHVAAALGMMANWDLDGLRRDLPRLAAPLVLVTGSNDRTVPPEGARKVAALVPGARLISMPGLGHLAHEERPEETAELLLAEARAAGLPGDG
ncbi:MAG: alpha/beta fold hydrolase BchO [Dongiaceae bacterium]